MALQVGMGFSRILLLVGAGYTGSIVLRNGRLSEILSELQEVLKDKSESGNDSDLNDVLASQVRRLAMEVRQLASARPITVLNGDSGAAGNISTLLVPAATLGAIGYVYMWCKGLSFSDLMYVTKRNMANAVSSMTKNLEQVSAALMATKKHLSQRMENLDGKLDEQKEISGEIRKEVVDACDKLENIGLELNSLQQLVCGLDGKMSAIEDKQNYACAGVMYLCQFVEGKGGRVPDALQDGLKPKRGFIGCAESRSLKGLQHITEVLGSGIVDKTRTLAMLQNDVDSLDNTKGQSRTPTIKC